MEGERKNDNTHESAKYKKECKKVWNQIRASPRQRERKNAKVKQNEISQTKRERGGENGG